MRKESHLLTAALAALLLVCGSSGPARADDAPVIVNENDALLRAIIEMLGPKPDPIPDQTIAVPETAVKWALEDLKKLPAEDQPYIRYLWIPPWLKDWDAVLAYMINSTIRRSNVAIPLVTEEALRQDSRQPRGLVSIRNGQMIRMHLGILCPKPDDFDEIDELIEEAAVGEFYFHFLDTHSVSYTKLISAAQQSGRIRGKSVRKTFHRIEKFAQAAKHLGPNIEALEKLTGSNNPVMRGEFFVRKFGTQVDGGVYYKASDIRPSDKKDISDLDAILKRLGASIKLSEKLESDMKVAMFRSKVTGKPRCVFMIKAVQGRDNESTIFITLDIGDADIDPDKHPMYNLIKFKDKAKEILYLDNAGFLRSILTNGEGKLQDEAPPDVVRDSQIPAPHTNRLNAGIVVCSICHGPHDGMQPLQNDVTRMFKLKIFDDLTLARKKGVNDVLDRIAGLYTGNFDKQLQRVRDDYSDAVFRVCRKSIPDVTAAMKTGYFAYMYAEITPEIACRELGYAVKPGHGAELLARIVQPRPINAANISPEDVTIGSLIDGIAVNRSDWERVYPEIATRERNARLERIKHAEEQKKAAKAAIMNRVGQWIGRINPVERN